MKFVYIAALTLLLNACTFDPNQSREALILEGDIEKISAEYQSDLSEENKNKRMKEEDLRISVREHEKMKRITQSTLVNF